jgi:tetratricopeptide (TPR) repeat protein
MRSARLLGFGLAGLMLACAGCTSLRYKKTEDLWAESDQKFKAGQYGDAVPYYDELLRRDDNDARARMYRGISRDRSGDTTDALDDYQKCADQGQTKALLFRAGLDIKSGFLDAAEKDLQALRGASLDTHEQVAQLTLIGELRLKQGNARMAVQSLERACELARGQSDSFTLGHARDANYNAAYAYYQLGEFQSGMEHMEQFRQISDTTGQGCDGRDFSMLCLLHYLSGDMEGARGYLSKCDPEWRHKAAQDFSDPAFFGS